MNPYAADLGDRDALTALVATPARIRALVAAMTAAGLERSYAPGKWTARQLCLHLAQTELAFGTRVRMALTTDAYTVQPFDQDRWMARETGVGADVALAAYEGMRALNLSLFRSLTPDDLSRAFMHPERGRMTVGIIPPFLAGHELHHLVHFEAIAAGV